MGEAKVTNTERPRPVARRQRDLVPPPASGPGRQRGRRFAATALVAAIGLGVGVVATMALTGGDDPTTDAAAPPDIPTSPEEVEAQIAGAADAGPAAAAAATPEAAVEGFLTAEAESDLAESYTFLSTADRAEYASPAGWESVHAELLAPVLGHQVEAAGEPTGATAEVVTLVDFEPSLDEVVGLVPGQARVTWSVARDDAGLWGVVLGESVLEPIYPDDAGVVPAAEAWAAARADCDDDPPSQRTPLLGIGDLAATLCDSPAATVSEPGPLPDADAAPFLTAFPGGTATTWARVVEIDGPETIRAVLAPIGSSWVVIGVLLPG